MTRIIAGRRSPVAPRGGALAALEVHDLAGPVIAAVLADAGLTPNDIDEVIVSNALGGGGNPARSIALAAGLPERVAGLTLDRQCAGGLDALLLADALIRSGQHDIVLAGGAESYSRRPLRLRTSPDGDPPEPYDQARFTPWPDRDPDMAEAANRLAVDLKIDRATQDAWAIRSHARARACPAPLHTAEVVEINGIGQDAFTRDLTERHCRKAPIVHGTITAANMAVAADAAAFVVMVSPRVAPRFTDRALTLVTGKTLGATPDLPGLAPVAAIEAILTDETRASLVSAEIMEAFSVQAIASIQGAHLPPEIVNRHGGALSRGHPVGASGAILAVRLFHQLRHTPGTGLAAIAGAGGLGTALLLQSA